MKSPAAGAPPSFLRLFRHTIPTGRELTLQRQRIYVLPTRYGLLFTAMLAVMLLGATNYNNSLGFLLTFLLTALGLVSILYTYGNLVSLQVRSGRALAVFVGQQARFVIHLYNPDTQPRRALWAQAAGTAAEGIDLAAGESGTLSLSLHARRRGRLPLGRITLSTTYPLGLVRAWSYVDLDMRCLIYPRPARDHASAAPRPDGGARNGAAPGGEDFSGFRVYRNGDSLRHIHWKGVARGQALMTKQFLAGEAPDLWLDWEGLPPLDVEGRLRLLCRLVLDAACSDRAYGLRIPGVIIPPDHGPLQRQRCLEALALFEEPRP